jgi:hypothetical protein
MEHKTKAHLRARDSGHECVDCGRDLQNAKYEGEYCFGYGKDGSERWMAVFLTCRCGCINEVTDDITDPAGFMAAVDDVYLVPGAAKKITAKLEMA